MFVVKHMKIREWRKSGAKLCKYCKGRKVTHDDAKSRKITQSCDEKPADPDPKESDGGDNKNDKGGDKPPEN